MKRRDLFVYFNEILYNKHIGESMNKNDMKLIVTCLVTILVGCLIYFVIDFNHKGDIGIVEYKEKVLLEFDLDKNEIYEFEGTVGIVHLEVKDGSFHVYDVDCPNHDCENMGWINKDSLFPIVCLPNEIIIYSKSN